MAKLSIKNIYHMLWYWLALEWYTGQLTLITPFKLDVILVGTYMSFTHIRDDISNKQASNQSSKKTDFTVDLI